MKFKEENSVEILKGEYGPCGMWFPGSIISVIGDYYLVRYDSVADSEGEPVREKVHKEDVRPKPHYKRGKRWRVGDLAEVFDIRSWRVGKIAKVLKDNIFVIRLFGSIQLKEFHASNLRILQAWHKNKWSVIEKVAKSNESSKNFVQKKAKFCGSLVCSSGLEVMGKDSCLRRKNGQNFLYGENNNVKKCLPVRMANRSNIHCLERSSKDQLSCVGGYDIPITRKLPLFRQEDGICRRKVRADEKFNEGSSSEMDTDLAKASTNKLYNSSRQLSTEDSNQCSVASCSWNNLPGSPACHNCNEALAHLSDSSDAESSYPSSCANVHLTQYFEEKLEVDIHELEFQAYKSTVQALYASGPLSWEQESLLTNLRLSLNISDEEHLLQLRHLLSTQIL